MSIFFKEVTIENYKFFKTIENYKFFKNKKIPNEERGSGLTVELNVPNGKRGRGLTVLIGDNGTGKTSILEAISILDYPANIDGSEFPNRQSLIKISAIKVEVIEGKVFSSTTIETTAKIIAETCHAFSRKGRIFQKPPDLKNVSILLFCRNKRKEISVSGYRTAFRKIIDELNRCFDKSIRDIERNTNTSELEKVRKELEALFSEQKDILQNFFSELEEYQEGVMKDVRQKIKEYEEKFKKMEIDDHRIEYYYNHDRLAIQIDEMIRAYFQKRNELVTRFVSDCKKRIFIQKLGGLITGHDILIRITEYGEPITGSLNENDILISRKLGELITGFLNEDDILIKIQKLGEELIDRNHLSYWELTDTSYIPHCGLTDRNHLSHQELTNLNYIPYWKKREKLLKYFNEIAEIPLSKYFRAYEELHHIFLQIPRLLNKKYMYKNEKYAHIAEKFENIHKIAPFNLLSHFGETSLALNTDTLLSQIDISNLGSGVQMLAGLLILKHILEPSKTKKENEEDGEIKSTNFIYLIDEPELHLHPEAQNALMELLLEESKTKQIVISTHSIELISRIFRPIRTTDKAQKQNSKSGDTEDNAQSQDQNNKSEDTETKSHAPVKFYLCKRNDNGKIELTEPLPESSDYPYPLSRGAIAFHAFGICTTDFHNELYGYLYSLYEPETQKEKYKTEMFDKELEKYKKMQIKRWIEISNKSYDVTICTYIRHSIHHPENNKNAPYTDDELKFSIEGLIEIIRKRKKAEKTNREEPTESGQANN
ncbi:AAA family ATPase [Candidatus Fokinia crypta]|uniref:Helicase family protein n=1 Tax=Candidatus Fokinia crypta TaxID=1920990 RepID=A0ABZ0UNR8_9RICK|nr:AAA family ATPase [Candidatus Fokinia cryptica]WPX97542.1 putative helicase family protein [Candidatus Fokinia cryptica]